MPHAITLTRHFRAPREKVFSAFTEKAAMQRWYGPRNASTPRCEVDARPGGKYRIELHSESGSVNVVTGEFHEVRPHERIVHTWAWLDGEGRTPETLVTLTFADKDGGTELTLVHSGFANPESAERHNQGWTSSFDCLGEALAGHAKPLEPTIVLLGDTRSSYTQAAATMLEEKGVAYARALLRPNTPEVLAINPFGKIPAMRIGALALYETSAILHYLDETLPGPSLTPKTAAGRAKMEQWISALNSYGYRYVVGDTILQMFFPRGLDGKPDMATIDAARPKVATFLGALDAAYGDKPYLTGDAPCLADVMLAPVVRYAGMIPGGEALLAPYPHLRRAHAVFAARPSFVEATRPPEKAAA